MRVAAARSVDLKVVSVFFAAFSIVAASSLLDRAAFSSSCIAAAAALGVVGGGGVKTAAGLDADTLVDKIGVTVTSGLTITEFESETTGAGRGDVDGCEAADWEGARASSGGGAINASAGGEDVGADNVGRDDEVVEEPCIEGGGGRRGESGGRGGSGCR